MFLEKNVLLHVLYHFPFVVILLQFEHGYALFDCVRSNYL